MHAEDAAPPAEGYTVVPRQGGFNDALYPIAYKVNEQGKLVFALKIGPEHCNTASICHGAVYMSLMDFAMAGALCSHLNKRTFTPTVNMNLNYMAATRAGEVIYAEAEVLRVTNTFAFLEAKAFTDSEVKLQASGIFRLPLPDAN